MPKRTDIKSILVIGSGPIIIAQAAEFDYAGAQACISLKEEGYRVILANSNPATIMTDLDMADAVYMEPLTVEYLEKIIAKEKPDALLATIGGQTGLTLAMKLSKEGILEKYGVEIIGTDFNSIMKGEDRDLFKEMCIKIGEPVPESKIATTVDEALEISHNIGYPVILRPAFTMGGSGGGFAYNDEELKMISKNALKLSPTTQVLIEKSIKNFKEIEYEVMRDANDTVIIVCNMENIDPVGIHTGDSMVVAPSQTLTNKEYQMLRNSSIKLIRELNIIGGCNIQFALDPNSMDYYIIEVNPRVSRSSALASKATGYPIAKVSAKIAVGYHLDEIQLVSTKASFEPTIDYIVSKIARFPFDKFITADRSLFTQMKATGETMAVGRSFKESFLKAVRSLEVNANHIYHPKFKNFSKDQLLELVHTPTDERIFQIAQLFRLDSTVEEVWKATKIDKWFLIQFKDIVDLEAKLVVSKGDIEILKEAKHSGFSDECIANLWEWDMQDIYELRKENGIIPVYKMMDMCAAEFTSYVPYFFSTYAQENESVPSDKKSVVVIGSGPIRIGQGVEFDYSSVHSIKVLQEMGYEAVIINNNPETVSTDYEVSDKLYFEPLNIEDVMHIIDLEKPEGVIVQFGGQTAINLADKLAERGVKIFGTDHKAIARAENRKEFEEILSQVGIPQPVGKTVMNIDDALVVANEITFPVLVRPSFVLGGRGMQVVHSDQELKEYWIEALKANKKQPVLIDKYIYGKEIEVDAVYDGVDTFIPGIMEHIEKTGIHSGDSILSYPTFSIADKVKQKIIDYTCKLGKALDILGMFNVQYIVDEKDNVYVIEVNPRASRTVPFISKSAGIDVAKIATKVALGISLKEQGIQDLVHPTKNAWYVKFPVFSSSKIIGIDAILSPEMKSTGEAIGYDKTFPGAIFKGFEAGGIKIINKGKIFVSVGNKKKEAMLPVVSKLVEFGFKIYSTQGTHDFLVENGIKSTVHKKLSEGSDEIILNIRKGFFDYALNLPDDNKSSTKDGYEIRKTAVENNLPIFTSLDTIKSLIEVMQHKNFGVSPIDKVDQ